VTGEETLDSGFAGPASFVDVGKTTEGFGFKTLEASEKDFVTLGPALLPEAGEGLGLDDELALAFPRVIARTLRLGLDADSSTEDEEDVVGMDAGVLERSLSGERGKAHLTVLRAVGAPLMRGVAGGDLVFSFPTSASLA
jgi:hypothetical protein